MRRWHDVIARAWAAPATAIGLACIAAGWRHVTVQYVDGVIEACGPSIAWGLRHLTLLKGGASALTLGHVVLARDLDTLDWTRRHERVHVRQYERWGALFLPAYVLASVWAATRGRHFYFDNPFEVEAFAVEAVSTSSTEETSHAQASARPALVDVGYDTESLETN